MRRTMSSAPVAWSISPVAGSSGAWLDPGVAGIPEPHHCLHEDPDRERDEHDAVRERGEDLGTLEPVATLRRGGLRGEPRGHERDSERDVVGQHVHRVRE